MRFRRWHSLYIWVLLIAFAITFSLGATWHLAFAHTHHPLSESHSPQLALFCEEHQHCHICDLSNHYWGVPFVPPIQWQVPPSESSGLPLLLPLPLWQDAPYPARAPPVGV